MTEREGFNLTEQIRRTIILFDAKMTEKGISLNTELDEVRFYGNRELLSQVWINILDNAVKFSAQNGDIRIRLAESVDFVALEVRDFGCGMDEDVKRHLFDRFYQGDSSHATEGYGLGMSIVKRIVDLCHGTVEYESAPEEGTLVRVVLPKQDPS